MIYVNGLHFDSARDLYDWVFHCCRAIDRASKNVDAFCISLYADAIWDAWNVNPDLTDAAIASHAARRLVGA